MIKKLITSLFVLCLPLAVFAADYDNGEYYDTLDVDATDAPIVTEFFSYYCPHCAKLEPAVLALEKSLPEGATLEKNHVNFLRIDRDAQNRLTQAYLIAKEQGKAHQASDAIFKSIHAQREPLQTEESVIKLLANVGIEPPQYAMLSASEEVTKGVENAIAKQNKYVQLGALTGVPTLIVKDKYKIKMQAITSQEDLNQLVQHLLKK